MFRVSAAKYDCFLKTITEVKKLANIKSAKKRVLTSRAQAELNKSARASLRTAIKKARAEGADAAVIKSASVSVDKAAGKGLIHKNKAARLKSQLAKKANAAN